MRESHSSALCSVPPAPDAEALQVIHRAADSVLTFHCKKDGEFENLFAVRCQHLETMFPEIAPALGRDSFVSLNGFWSEEKHRHYLSAAQVRQATRLRYLNCCFCDLDYYSRGLTYGQAIGQILDMQDAGMIPEASIIVRSGRGIWLLWLLVDPAHPDLPPRAWPEKQRQYERLQDRIHDALAEVGADAKDSLRLVRVPGSMHSGTGNRVEYWVHHQADGKIPSYSLDELTAGFGEPLLLPRDNPTMTALPRGSAVPARSAGPRALTGYRVRDFETLLALRSGGFDQGCRNRAAFYYGWLLRCQRFKREAALGKVIELGQKCRPPLSLAECRDAIKTAFNPTWRTRKFGGLTCPASIKYQVVADMLLITPTEAKHLTKYPAAAMFGQQPRPAALSPKQTAIASRRSTVARIVANMGHVPSWRSMSQLLAAEGIRATRGTVASDYAALALKSWNG